MIRFLLNIALAAAWCALTGFDGWHFVAGLLVGAIVVSACSRALGAPSYLGKLARLVGFGAVYCRLLTLADCKVAWEVLTPRLYMQPRIIRLPIADLSEAHLVSLANAITLTPGTLIVDLSPDRRFLYVHCMYARERDAAERELTDLARRLDEGVFR